ncbi:MAG TPA: ketopantoate reductase family protein [Anaerolineales bacterium]|nr:ketopantoate reductase family protein [Anaerolineales bacterium]
MTRIAILGAGAIGSVLGGFLSRAGEDVTLIGRSEQVNAIHRSGLHIDGVSGSFVARLPVTNKLDFRPDFTFLTVKTQDVLTALQANKGFFTNTTLVTFQNGVRSDELAATVVPRAQIISAVVNISATCLMPGKVTVTYPGSLVIGRPFGDRDTQLDSLVALLQHVAPTSLSANIQGVHWLKLIFNLNNAFPALLNVSLHEVYADLYLRELAARVMREGLQVVRQAGIRLEALPEASVTLFQILGILPPPLAGWLLAFSVRRVRSEWPLLGSTLQSLRRGRPTEIDYLNGEIVRLGEQLGRSTPFNAAIVEMVHQVEQTGQFWTVDEIRTKMTAAMRAK